MALGNALGVGGSGEAAQALIRGVKTPQDMNKVNAWSINMSNRMDKLRGKGFASDRMVS